MTRKEYTSVTVSPPVSISRIHCLFVWERKIRFRSRKKNHRCLSMMVTTGRDFYLRGDVIWQYLSEWYASNIRCYFQIEIFRIWWCLILQSHRSPVFNERTVKNQKPFTSIEKNSNNKHAIDSFFKGVFSSCSPCVHGWLNILIDERRKKSI